MLRRTHLSRLRKRRTLIRMGDAGFEADRFAGPLLERAPACQWFFNRAHQFYYIGGDSESVFHRPIEELRHQHVSTVKDPRGRWAARIKQVFEGNSLVEQPERSGLGHALIHVPLLASDGSVFYASGFAYSPGRRIPAPLELELASYLTLQAVSTERARTARFLHDVVAQCLTGTGLQIELLAMETKEQAAGPSRTAEMQRTLEEAIERVRQFISEQEGRADA